MNIDHTSANEFRGYIRTIYVNDQANLKEAIMAVLDYCWNNLQCDSVRVDQHHFDTDGKLNCDKEIKELLIMEKKGFKWKSIYNKDGIRA